MSDNRISPKQVLDDTARSLAGAGIDMPRLEARRLLCWALGCDSARLMTLDFLPRAAQERLAEGLARRCNREPMALIEGEAGFWSLTLEVSADTLIPRGDSETLIEALLALRPDRLSIGSILDLGTGTGCLLLAALSEYDRAFGIGIDLSPEAASLARRNARRNGLEGRSAFMAANWCAALRGGFDIILSNPPYIPSGDIAGLMPEVREYEPLRALAGGQDGLEAYRIILAQARTCLTEGGLLVFEIGQGQEHDVQALAEAQGFVLCEARADLGHIVRALCFERMPGHSPVFA